MTIDEVIAHQRELAEDFREFQRTSVSIRSNTAFKKMYDKQIKECEQIAEWLEELKERRQTNFDYVSLMDKRYYDGYNKAIDDFVEKATEEQIQYDCPLDMHDVEEIAERLKAGGTDE